MIDALTSPMPEPAEFTAGGMSFDGWLVPLVVAMIGIVGVSIGGWLASGSALRIRLMDMTQRAAETQRDFQVRAVSAVNDLGIALAVAMSSQEASVRAVLEDAVRAAKAAKAPAEPVNVSLSGFVPLDPVVHDRVVVATQAWRAVLAEAHAFADQTMATAFEDFDNQRARVADAFNAASTLEGVQEAARECATLRSVYGPRIYRVLQVEKAKGSWRMYELAHTRRIRLLARRLARSVAGEINRGLQLIEESKKEVAEHGGNGGSAP